MYSNPVAFLTVAQVPPVTVSQRQDGASGSKHALPIMRKRMALGPRVYFYGFCSDSVHGRLRTDTSSDIAIASQASLLATNPA